MTIDDLRQVCAAAEGEFRTLLTLGIYTGLRLGDCATLRWNEVDLARNVIRRIPTKTARRNPKPVMVPLHGSLTAILSDTPQEQRLGDVLPELATTYRRDPTIITHRTQEHFKTCGIRLYTPGTGITCDDNGDPVRTGKRAVLEVGFHSLRHSFVSLCRAAGAPLAVVEAIVGHASPAMTRHYTHIGEAAATAAVAALPDITGQAIAKPALPAANVGTVPKAKVRELTEKLTPKNAVEIKAKMLELIAGE